VTSHVSRIRRLPDEVFPRGYALAVGLDVQVTLLGRAALAALLGFAIGLEREYRHKVAGDRTFALLAFGAAAVTAVGAELLGVNGTSRAIQGVVTGVGFVGAGLIFRSERGVRGLTTAASSWAVTGVAVLAGVGAYLSAAVGAVLVIIVLELDRIPLFSRIPPSAPPGDVD
jgi:putative Mg2+ transporter-C (MgtC) family protein